MRVTKASDGSFRVDDEPLHLDGEAAKKFLAEMARNEQGAQTEEQKKFLESCDHAYRSRESKKP